MTLMDLMSVSSDDTWFYLLEKCSTGVKERTFYNADYLVRDSGVLEILRPFLGKKVLKVSLVRRQDHVTWLRRYMLAIELEEKDDTKPTDG